MLLELARWLQGFARFFALFDYITMRAILGALTALGLSLWLGPTVIARLARLKGGQPIRKDGPARRPWAAR
jgi:phospho-N-acetylmuramoyl-pentapeptide-transferase